MAEKISAVDIIMEEIARYGGKQKRTQTHRIVLCPFHKESHPSCSINISGTKVSVGTFKCWSCNKSGNWNIFADKTGLKKIKKWQAKLSDATYHGVSEDEERAMLGSSMSHTDLADALAVEELGDWQAKKEWRGLPGKLLVKLGCKFVIDRRSDEPMLLCPVVINGETVGGVKAILEKKRKRQLAYITSKGSWVKDLGIFPYDHVRKMLRRKKLRFIILVEGPRDALRLISEGLPAVAILGANNFGTKKALKLFGIGELDYIFTMPDNDAGGTLMHKLIRKSFKGMSKVYQIKLPRKKDKHKNLIKIDPMSAPQEVIDDLKEGLEEMGLL